MGVILRTSAGRRGREMVQLGEVSAVGCRPPEGAVAVFRSASLFRSPRRTRHERRKRLGADAGTVTGGNSRGDHPVDACRYDVIASNDLCGEMGISWANNDHPKLEAAFQRAIAAARKVRQNIGLVSS